MFGFHSKCRSGQREPHSPDFDRASKLDEEPPPPPPLPYNITGAERLRRAGGRQQQ